MKGNNLSAAVLSRDFNGLGERLEIGARSHDELGSNVAARKCHVEKTFLVNNRGRIFNKNDAVQSSGRHWFPQHNSETSNVAVMFCPCKPTLTAVKGGSSITGDVNLTSISALDRRNWTVGLLAPTHRPAIRPEALEHSNWSSLNNASDRV